MGEAAKAILVVEDNPADIYLIRKAVAECNPHIHLSVIPNGRDALAFLRQEGAFGLEPSPALILLDLNLPKLDGHEVLTELRHLPMYQATPVVIFSAARQEQEEQLVLAAGGQRVRAKTGRDREVLCCYRGHRGRMAPVRRVG